MDHHVGNPPLPLHGVTFVSKMIQITDPINAPPSPTACHTSRDIMGKRHANVVRGIGWHKSKEQADHICMLAVMQSVANVLESKYIISPSSLLFTLSPTLIQYQLFFEKL